MAVKSLAIKYRPKTWASVTEQEAIKEILTNQLETNTTKNAYLFCGGAGTGKTTSARIFANEINKGQGNPIELDAASNNSVDDVRELTQQAKTKSLDSEYKVFIIDECHMLSNGAWNAMLKLIEEPPAKSIFIFCTTDPQKIPKTILSRVQRYDFQKISQKGIVARLEAIIAFEGTEASINYNIDAVEYIAKLADGHMRDAITMLDKCISYSEDITLDNVVKAIGAVDYEMMFNLTDAVVKSDVDANDILNIIETINQSGKDLKQFVKSYFNFVLDINKYTLLCDFAFIQIPQTYEERLEVYTKYDTRHLLYSMMKLNADIKWDNTPKAMIEASLLIEKEHYTE